LLVCYPHYPFNAQRQKAVNINFLRESNPGLPFSRRTLNATSLDHTPVISLDLNVEIRKLEKSKSKLI